MANKLDQSPLTPMAERQQFASPRVEINDLSPLAKGLDDRRLITKPKPARAIPFKWYDIYTATIRALQFEQSHGMIFICAVALMASGCLIYFTHPTEPNLRPMVLGLFVLYGLAFLARQYVILKTLCLGVSCIVLGLIMGKVHTTTQDTQLLGSEVNSTITGQIIEFEPLANGRKRLLLEVIHTKKPKLKYLQGRLRLSYRGEENFKPGDIIQGRGRLFPPGGPAKPDGFDFAYSAYFANLAATGIFFGAPKIQTLEIDTPLSLRLEITIQHIRQGLENRIKIALPGNSGNLASALVTGRKAAISDNANEALRATGLAHILSISGLHMALVAGGILFSIRGAFALFPLFSLQKNTKKLSAIVALSGATFYLGVSGAGVATQRSYVMIAIVLIAIMVDRQALTMRNLAIAAATVLMLHPNEILGAGFHMSFAATAALIAAYAAMNKWREQRARAGFQPRQWPFGLNGFRYILIFFGGLALTSLIAGAATGLYSLYHFERFAPYGVVANMAAMPMVTLVIMPSALLAMMLMPFDLDYWAWKLMGVGIEYVVWVAEKITVWTPATGSGIIPLWTMIGGTLALVLLTILKTRLALIALVPAIIAIFSLQQRVLPIGYIHERGDTVGMINHDGNLALNRSRVSSFITDQWQRSLAAHRLQKPNIDKTRDTARLFRDMSLSNNQGIFQCNDATCLFADGDAISLIIARSDQALMDVCRHLKNQKMDGSDSFSIKKTTLIAPEQVIIATKYTTPPLIVFDGVFVPPICNDIKDMISTNQQRASQGSIALKRDSDGNVAQMASLANLERPWHHHRAFSRAARGLDEYKKKLFSNATNK